MDGYSTTLIKAPALRGSVELAVTAGLLCGLMSIFIWAEAPEIVLAICGFYLLIATLLSSYSSRVQVSWGPKGLAYSDGILTRYTSFQQISGVRSKVWRMPKNNISYLLILDSAGKELMRIETRFFSDSDIELIIRALENNSRANIEVDELRALRLEKKAAIFCIDEKKNPGILNLARAKGERKI